MNYFFYFYSLLILFLFMPMWAQAQGDLTDGKTVGSNQDARFRLTLLGGFNASQIDGDDLAGFNKVGLNVGGQVNILLDRTDWVGRFQPSVGFGFTQLGSSPGNNDDAIFLSQRFRLAYAQIPLMLNYVDQRWVFSAGFAYGRLVNSGFIDSNGLDVTDVVANNYSTNDVNFIGGTTFYLTRNLGINVQWEHSLLSINSIGRQVHRLITFRAAYTF